MSFSSVPPIQTTNIQQVYPSTLHRKCVLVCVCQGKNMVFSFSYYLVHERKSNKNECTMYLMYMFYMYRQIEIGKNHMD